MRIYSALIGSLTIIPLYLLCKILFNKKIALLSSFLFAVSHYAIAYSRIAIHVIETPFWETWSFFLLLMGFRRKSYFYILLSALTCAFGFYHYFASRIVPGLIVVLFFLYFFNKERKFSIVKLFVFWIIAFIVFLIPFIIGFSKNIQLGRESEIFLPLNVQHFLNFQGVNNVWDLIKIQTIKGFSLYTIGIDSSNHYGGPAPRLDIITAVFFILGIAISLTKIKNYQMAFLLSWFILTVFIGNVLTDTPPISTRVIGVIPALTCFSAIGLNFFLNNFNNWRKKAFIITIILSIFCFNIKTYFSFPPYYPWIEPKSSIAFYLNSKGENYNYYIFNNSDVYAKEQILSFLTAGHNLKVNDLSLPLLEKKSSNQKSIFIIPSTTQDCPEIIETLKTIFPEGKIDKFFGRLDIENKSKLLFISFQVD